MTKQSWAWDTCVRAESELPAPGSCGDLIVSAEVFELPLAIEMMNIVVRERESSAERHAVKHQGLIAFRTWFADVMPVDWLTHATLRTAVSKNDYQACVLHDLIQNCVSKTFSPWQ
jgi:hypothetical protein